MSAVASITVHRGVIEVIKRHSRQQQEKGGYEAVGFMAANKDMVVATLPMHNHSADPQHTYFVEPWEQFRAEQKLTGDGYRIAGIYHSHPVSEARPSKADLNMARPGELMAIYSVVFDDLRFYREDDGRLELVHIEEAS